MSNTNKSIFEGNPKSELIINGAIKGVKSFDRSGVSLLQYASIILILCALATMAILFVIKIFNWWTYITYKDYYVDNFYYFLDTKQLNKAEAYTENGKRDSEVFKNLLETYYTDKTKFQEISNAYIENIRRESKEYFENTPIYDSQFWHILKQLLFLVIYTIISVSTWNLLKDNPEVLNPINKSSYYSMIKSIIFTPSQKR